MSRKKYKYVCTYDGVELDGVVYYKGDIVVTDRKINITYFSEVTKRKKKEVSRSE